MTQSDELIINIGWINLIAAAVAEEASLVWLNLQMFGDSPDLQRPTSYSR